MQIHAQVRNRHAEHQATVTTNGTRRSVAIAPRESGFGSSVSGGELLFLALATCYCNDIYREAARRGITVNEVEVEVDGEFGAVGEPASRISYRARVTAQGPQEEVQALMRETDSVAEIQNTLRAGVAVTLREIEAVTADA